MAKIAQQQTGNLVHFELSIKNVDKPLLDYIEISKRLEPLKSEYLWLTQAARFSEKAKLFPGAIFIVGVDTITRIADIQYYDRISDLLESTINAFCESGCKFLVFGRLVEGRFITLSKLDLPEKLRSICYEIEESKFRQDISSTRVSK